MQAGQHGGESSVAVVGAGWAGLAAALALAEAGCRVTVYDAAPTAGGRARSISLTTPLGQFELDNGQHLMVGAYRESLALIDRLGAGRLLSRSPLALSSPAGLSLRAARLPAPLHLAWAVLRARGLGAGARRALLRLMAGLRLAGWRPLPGETVAALLRRFGQPEPLVDSLWAPLCIGALNTLPEEACAAAFAVVLRDTLGASRADSDFLTSRAPLGALLPEPALARLQALGARIQLRTPVRRLVTQPANGRHDRPRWRIGTEDHDAVLLALPPWSTATLLAASGIDPEPLPGLEAEPIATAWVLWQTGTAPALPRWSLLEDAPERGRHGQWLFDRGIVVDPQGRSARLAGIVISLASRLDRHDPAAIAAGITAQLAEAFGGPPPAALRLVTERRATFRCTPGRPRPAMDLLAERAPGLWLAGDWLWPDYPATLEAAVRSGQAAARRLLAATGGEGMPA